MRFAIALALVAAFPGSGASAKELTQDQLLLVREYGAEGLASPIPWELQRKTFQERKKLPEWKDKSDDQLNAAIYNELFPIFIPKWNNRVRFAIGELLTLFPVNAGWDRLPENARGSYLEIVQLVEAQPDVGTYYFEFCPGLDLSPTLLARTLPSRENPRVSREAAELTRLQGAISESREAYLNVGSGLARAAQRAEALFAPPSSPGSVPTLEQVQSCLATLRFLSTHPPEDKVPRPYATLGPTWKEDFTTALSRVEDQRKHALGMSQNEIATLDAAWRAHISTHPTACPEAQKAASDGRVAIERLVRPSSEAADGCAARAGVTHRESQDDLQRMWKEYRRDRADWHTRQAPLADRFFRLARECMGIAAPRPNPPAPPPPPGPASVGDSPGQPGPGAPARSPRQPPPPAPKPEDPPGSGGKVR